MRIKQILQEKGITQKEFAKRLGMSETGLSLAISDDGNPPLKRLKQIADALGVNIAELFEAEQPVTETICCPKCDALIKVAITKVHIQVIGEQTFTPNDATDTEDNQQTNQ